MPLALMTQLVGRELSGHEKWYHLLVLIGCRDEHDRRSVVTRLCGIVAVLARISQCAVKGVLFPAGANPARQLSLQPEALEAVQGGNELD